MKKKKIDFRQIGEARKILGLGEEADADDIKKAYRKLARKYHPDKCPKSRKKKCEARFKKINDAHKILMAYCLTYGTSLRAKEVIKNTMGKEYYDHLRRFYDGWWGEIDL